MSFPWQPVGIAEFVSLVGGGLAWITTRSDLAGQLSESAVERAEMNQELLDLQRRVRESDDALSAAIKSHSAELDRQREELLAENVRLSQIMQRQGACVSEAIAERDDLAAKCRLHIETILRLETDLETQKKNTRALQESYEAELSEVARLTRLLQEKTEALTLTGLECQKIQKRADDQSAEKADEYRTMLMLKDDGIAALLAERDKLKSEKEALEKALFEIKQRQPARKKGRK